MSRLGSAPALLLLPVVLSAAPGRSDAPAALLAAADAARHPLAEGSVRIRITVEEEGKTAAPTDLVVYLRGSDHALCVFDEGPGKGRKVLMVGERVWLLLPGTSRPIPVSASQRLLGGASIADVAHLRFALEFTAVVRHEEETVDGTACRVLDLAARSRKSSYAAGTLWISKADSLARKARLTLRSGKDAKEMRFVDYARQDGKMVLRRMEILHLLPSERGMRTLLEFVRYEAGSVPDAFFDPEAARELP